ncbi:MAG TPA: TSUP family transporter [Alphaproteobacteria bacterium]|nr:TSUP family transporter [Alphaproteobacteria bacterium]
MVSESFEVLALLFAVAGLAGFIDSIAGGGGLLVLPALFTAGLPPQAVLATSKLQASFGSLSASLAFIRAGAVDLRAMAPAIAATFVGSTAGALLIAWLDPEFLRDLIPLLLIAIAVYMLVSPRIGEIDAHQRLGFLPFSLGMGLLLGFYDGFFGPGTGSFWAIAFVVLLGYNLKKATAHTKIVNFTSNIAALIVLALGGHVWWTIGLVMAAGQFLGAQLGARMVMSKGTALVKPMLVTMSLLITARIIYTDADNPLRVAALKLWALVVG